MTSYLSGKLFYINLPRYGKWRQHITLKLFIKRIRLIPKPLHCLATFCKNISWEFLDNPFIVFFQNPLPARWLRAVSLHIDKWPWQSLRVWISEEGMLEVKAFRVIFRVKPQLPTMLLLIASLTLTLFPHHCQQTTFELCENKMGEAERTCLQFPLYKQWKMEICPLDLNFVLAELETGLLTKHNH